ncbi:MAG: energy-coupling factor transporter transmembrane component T [Candidatus Caldarchaeum sp.]
MGYTWYVEKRTYLHRVSPLPKIAMVSTMWFMAFILQSPLWNALELGIVIAVIVSARVPFSKFLTYVKIIVPVMFIFLLLFAILIRGGETLLELGPLGVTSGGLSAGVIGSSRLGTLFFSTIGILLTTTREIDIVKALVKIRLPATVAFLFMMSMRFVTLSMSDLQTIREARRSRALPERENTFQFIQNLISIVIPLFIVTIRRIQTASNALEVKGFPPQKRNANWLRSPLSRGEVCVVTGCLVFTGVMAFFRLVFGWFT